MLLQEFQNAIVRFGGFLLIKDCTLAVLQQSSNNFKAVLSVVNNWFQNHYNLLKLIWLNNYHNYV